LQMEKDDKGSTLIRIGVRGESSFWYRPTRVVPDQRPLNGRLLLLLSVCLSSLFSNISIVTRALGRML